MTTSLVNLNRNPPIHQIFLGGWGGRSRIPWSEMQITLQSRQEDKHSLDKRTSIAGVTCKNHEVSHSDVQVIFLQQENCYLLICTLQGLPAKAQSPQLSKSWKYTVPLWCDGPPIPITGAFPTLIAFNVAPSPSKVSHRPLVSHQRTAGGKSDGANVQISRFARREPVLNLCTAESGH